MGWVLAPRRDLIRPPGSLSETFTNGIIVELGDTDCQQPYDPATRKPADSALACDCDAQKHQCEQDLRDKRVSITPSYSPPFL